MSKASEWAEKMKKADDEKDFTWRRVHDVERDRPTFIVTEPYHGTEPLVSTIGEGGFLVIGNHDWVPGERALAWAHWIIETFSDAPKAPEQSEAS